MSKPKLLLVDDDPGILRTLRWSFDNFDVITASDRGEAIQAVRDYRPPVVTLDLGLPPDPDSPREGLEALAEILTMAPRTKVIVVTGQDERENAVEAVGLGAYDFYHKPIDADVLSLIVGRAFQLTELEGENRRLKQTMKTPLAGVISASAAMLKVCRTIEKVAPTDMNVLLLGESGTGKEVLARAVHRASPRHDQPFVAINCAAIPENLLESELFGHEKGAFTGAHRQVKGKVETASGGTLFLDEIGDMPISLQAKLLRFLEERIIERVGGRNSIPVDVRVMAATNQDLQNRIAEQAFREDLFYRLSTISVDIPPLRDREDDAVILASYFIDGWASDNGKKVPKLSGEAISAIRDYRWPGNVRELENKVKRALVLADGPFITADDLNLPTSETTTCTVNGADISEPDAVNGGSYLTLKEIRTRAEKEALIDLLAATGGNLTEVARILDVSRPTVYNLMNQHGLRSEQPA